jgi:hypothetical protein
MASEPFEGETWFFEIRIAIVWLRPAGNSNGSLKPPQLHGEA